MYCLWISLSKHMYGLRGDDTLHLSRSWCNSLGRSSILSSLVEVFGDKRVEGLISRCTPLLMPKVPLGRGLILCEDSTCWFAQKSRISWSVLGEWMLSRRSMDSCESSTSSPNSLSRFSSISSYSSSNSRIVSSWTSSTIACKIWSAMSLTCPKLELNDVWV